MNNGIGWVKVDRVLQYDPVFSSPELLQLYLYCIFQANTTEGAFVPSGKVKPIKILQGQFATSRKSIAKDLGIAERTAYDRMKVLEQLGHIQINSNSNFSIVSVKMGENANSNPNKNTDSNPNSNFKQKSLINKGLAEGEGEKTNSNYNSNPNSNYNNSLHNNLHNNPTRYKNNKNNKNNKEKEKEEKALTGCPSSGEREQTEQGAKLQEEYFRLGELVFYTDGKTFCCMVKGDEQKKETISKLEYYEGLAEHNRIQDYVNLGLCPESFFYLSEYEQKEKAKLLPEDIRHKDFEELTGHEKTIVYSWRENNFECISPFKGDFMG